MTIRDQVVEALAAIPQPATAQEIAAHMGRPLKAVSSAICRARYYGFIDFAGTKPSGSQTPWNVYKLPERRA